MKTKSIPTNNLGQNMARIRKEERLSTDGMAYLCGVSRMTIYNIEAGIKGTTVPLLLKICTILERSPNELLGWPETPTVDAQI
jgi:DNA-binding XRE family transcriptional regulator